MVLESQLCLPKWLLSGLHRLWLTNVADDACSPHSRSISGLRLQTSPKTRRALPTETKVQSGTSQSKSGTCVNLSNSRFQPESLPDIRDKRSPVAARGREFFIANLLVRIHSIIEMI